MSGEYWTIFLAVLSAEIVLLLLQHLLTQYLAQPTYSVGQGG